MRLIFCLGLAVTVLAGCEQCSPSPNVGVNVGVGSGGVSGGVAIGQSCGPVNVSIGGGDYWHVAF